MLKLACGVALNSDNNEVPNYFFELLVFNPREFFISKDILQKVS